MKILDENEQLAADIRIAPVTGGNDVDLSRPLAQHLTELGYRKTHQGATVETVSINALLTEVGVNMGDHAQDVTKAVIAKPDMTVQELCDKFLTKRTWMGLNEPDRKAADPDRSLTIRLAVETTE
ncbi:hypothetical protein PP634_gp47 [Arthrobacter phage Richie]|uniref:Uncharacterized protein n=1 Tax=Arthrobacter phage Richie TaxID=2419967 RepID=A0A3G2KIQ0_9CAUD|nr:hypothetical protein PP634_gp47 [Arthrobacter phage Richie]AYN58873.1 hypothetical protein PBI_RICHIE_47 [Arthrobacter phage Richie]